MSLPAIEKVTAFDKQHDGDVTSIIYHNEVLYSAGSDGKIKMWDSDLNFQKEISIHEAYIYAIAVDKKGQLYTSSVDGTIKFVEKPLESDSHIVMLEHENEIEAIFVTDDLTFYCGDSKGGVTCFEDRKFKFTLNTVEAVKSLYVEKSLLYTLLNLDLSIHEIRDSGKFSMVASIPGKFPVFLFGEKTNGRSKYIALLTRDGKGISIIKNGVGEKFQTLTVKENLHELIVNAIQGIDNFLFTCDYSGQVIKTLVEDRELQQVASINTGSGCANCIAVADSKSVFIGSSDGSIKKISFR